MKSDGWSNTYSVAHASTVRCADMTCDKCGRKIRKNSYYLILDRTNFKHRGNETDERYLFHRDCSPVKQVWENHDRELVNSKKRAEEREARIADLKIEIGLLGLSECDLF